MRSLFSLVVVLGLLPGCGNGGQATNIRVPGMSAQAAVHFDQHGVLNAQCQTDEDCAAVLGYYHAKERFVQMDLQRRLPTGRLTDILAPALAEGLALPTAIDSRALYSTTDGRPAEEALAETASEKTNALMAGYAAGVNAWLEDLRNGRNGAQFPREFQDPLLDYPIENVPDWTITDSWASVLLLIELLTNDEGGETAQGLARAALGDDDRFSDLFSREPLKHSSVLPPGTYSPSNPMGSSLTIANTARSTAISPHVLPVLERVHSNKQRLNAFRGLLGMGIPGDELGSNNWVISPELSESGNALLSNDPHLGMVNPPIWYLAHLDSKTSGTGTMHTAGVTLAGVPWVVIGQNEDIAWGMTTTVFDMSDVYIEKLVLEDDEPVGVLFDGETVPFTRVNATFDYNDGTSTTEELLFVPHHGPVRSIDIENETAVTLRWTGQDASTDANFLTELAVAATVEEARDALTNITTVGQNVVVVDTAGNIGWFPYNTLPKRTWATNLEGSAPPWVPLDGRCTTSETCYEWTETYGPSELPQLLNPEAGYIATANNDMTGALFDGDPTNDGYALLQTAAAPGYRHARVVEMLEDEAFADGHTLASIKTIIDDVHSLIGEDLVPAILALADGLDLSEDADAVVTAIEEWGLTCPTGLEGTDALMSPIDSATIDESAGCTAFHVALHEIDLAMVGDDIEAIEAKVLETTGKEFTVPVGRGPKFATYHTLLDPDNSGGKLASGDGYCDDVSTEGEEPCEDIVEAALETAGAWLAERYDGSEWAWGRIHSLTTESQLAALGLNGYNNPATGESPYANDGGLFTIDVANPSKTEGEPYTQNWGPSTRFQCEALPTGPVCTIQLPGGQSGHNDSPNYTDLLPGWLANEPMDLVFDMDTARANAASTVVLGP